MTETYNQMLKIAIQYQEKAYAPYSNFHVGASVLLNDGKIIGGMNIENASYPLCNCAERNALYRTYMEGYTKKDIKMLLVVTKTLRPGSPCGACRQVMAELMEKDAIVLLANNNGEIIETTVEKLLPYAFEGSDLNV